jgi:hypothetical protein
MYTCKRCGYETSYKCAILTHLRRKKPCLCTKSDISPEQLISEITSDGKERSHGCNNCDKVYTTRQALSVHKKKCMASTINSRTDNEEIEHLKKQMVLLECKLKEVEQRTVTNTTNNNTMNQQNNINIHVGRDTLCSFGKESMNHITPEFLKQCLLQTYDGVKSFVNELHCNPDVPENHNIRFKSTKQKLVEVYKDERWVECNQTTTLDSLIKNGYKVLFQAFLDLQSDPLIKEYQNEIQDWLNRISMHSGVPYYNLRRDICLLIKDRTMYALAKTS